MKQKDLAAKIGISPQLMSLYKTGKRRIPVSLLIKIRDELGLKTIDDALQIIQNFNKAS